MSHVAPHRWADAWAGKLAEAERIEIERHADACPSCARARERVTRASDSFASIKNLSPPDVGWDAVRAKVHWSVSTERRARVPARSSRRRIAWFALGGAAAIAAGAFALGAFGGSDESGTGVAEHPSATAAPIAPAPAAPAALAGIVNRTTGDVMVDGILPADPFALRLHAGTVIATGAGRVDVQFGADSAFALGPHSRLELVRFDKRAVELAIDGTIDVEVAPRAPEQTFVVRAGTRTIEVRGTQFRVRHVANAPTAIACRHGLVAVHDADPAAAPIEVGTARRVELGGSEARVVPMSIEEVTALVEATPLTMPVWDLGTLANSAPLAIATSDHRAVRVDGVEVGEAPMKIRVMPGRHTVEAADDRGRYRRAGWVDVAAPSAHAPPAHLAVLPEPAPDHGIDMRRRQLRAGIRHDTFAACTRVAAKQGLLAGAYVQIEISVDTDGSVGMLNVIETDLPHKLADCIHGVLRQIRFRPGPAATWRERIDL